MCGISAIVSKSDVVPTLHESIKNLEYRGYDSCGLGVLDHDRIEVRKNTGGVDEVNQKEHFHGMRGRVGIAHTRWATHGGVTQQNAHPHVSFDSRFAIVHNGIINNYRELRAELQAQGIAFKSETDTEVLVHLIALAYAEFGDVEQAFVAALQRIDGTMAVAMISTLEPEHIFGMKLGSPLVLGLGQGANFIASDVNAFLPYTKTALILEDGEYAKVSRQEATVRRIGDQSAVNRAPLHIEWDAETSRKGGYSHYMLKEIFDQPQTLRNALKLPKEGIVQLAQSIQHARTAYLIGVGTTYYVALVGQYFFSKLAGRYLPALSSDEFNELAVVGAEDLVISISQSGETYDTRNSVKHAQARKAKTAGIVNVMGSSLSMMVDQVIMQGSGAEICVVSTKAALAQMVILHMVALELGRATGCVSAERYRETHEEFAEFPDQVQTILNEISGFVRNLADETAHYRNWLFLGRGVYYPIALEASLKVKEVTYLHAEGMSAGFLKHGTLAMVDPDMMSLFFLPPPSEKALHDQTLAAVEEVKARRGPVMAFLFADDAQARKAVDRYIELPPVPSSVAPLLELIVAQLFAYFSALKLGRSIDKPRNLAKSVTVG
jgi:glucosamine--fructose-6-phosphate aminotransferase (isomerizing)